MAHQGRGVRHGVSAEFRVRSIRRHGSLQALWGRNQAGRGSGSRNPRPARIQRSAADRARGDPLDCDDDDRNELSCRQRVRADRERKRRARAGGASSGCAGQPRGIARSATTAGGASKTRGLRPGCCGRQGAAPPARYGIGTTSGTWRLGLACARRARRSQRDGKSIPTIAAASG